MKEKYTKTRNQMIAARSRNVARLFAGRIYVRSDKVFIVNGNPDPEILFKNLCVINEVPDFEKEPDPRQLGFSASEIRPVGNKELNDWSQALLKWQKIAQMMESKRRHKSENKKKLEKWKIETEYLEKRRELLYDLKSQKTLSENPVTKWIPSDADEIRVDKVFAEIAPGKVLPELWRWFATITCWIGGEAGFLRFINALSKVCLTRYQYELEHSIAFIHKKFNQFQKDLEHDSNEELFRRVKDLLGSMPVEILNDVGIKQPRRIRAIEDYFKQQLPHIEKKYNAIKRIDLGNIVISSIISALDGSIAPFPSGLLTNPIQNKTEFLQTLLDYSISNHYQKLLSTLDIIQTEEYTSSEVKSTLNMLSAGADHEDINWIFKQRIQHYLLSDFSKKRLSPKSLRLITSVLKDYGEDNYSKSEVEYVLDRLISCGSTWFIDMFSEWLIKVPKKFWEKSTARSAWNTLLSGLALSELDVSSKSIIHQWANPQDIKLKLNLPGELSPEIKKNLRALVHYQKLLGRGVVFPDSLNNLLMAGQKKYQELIDLRKLKENETLPASANSRLLKLEIELKGGADKISLNENKIRRKVQEITARLALEALSEIVRNKHLWYFENEFKTTPPGWLKFHELSDIILWTRQLQDKQKKVFNKIFNAWKDYGPDYKAHLSLNKDWLGKILKRNKNIEKWLYSKEMNCQVSGKRLTIGLSNDPFRIFLMGSYFDTCLGIRTGSNRDSVLANAYDLNKGVVFAIDDHGIVKARKLIAVNDNGCLVGFNTYINSNESGERKVIKEKMTLFCARLADNTQLKLANTSERIQSLTGIFWYDDGYERWESKILKELNIQVYRSDKYPDERIDTFRIQDLAIQNKSYLRDIMSRIGLWKLMKGKPISKSYQESPDLIEEALVYVAKENANLSLLKELINCCQTRSGKFEVLLADLILTGTKMPENSDFNRLEFNNLRIDIALCDANTEFSIPIILNRSLQQDYPGDKEILFHLLWRSPRSAPDLISFLMKEHVWNARSDELFTIIHFLSLHMNGKLPDALINAILTHHHLTNLGGIFEKQILAMSQWLPVLKNSNSYLTMKFLLNEYNDKEYYKEFPDNQLVDQIGIIIWAMRNKCTAARYFLKELSKTVPSALLAFSLISETFRFKNFITKTALQYIASPAAMMSLLYVHGSLKTREILRDNGLLGDSEIRDRYFITELVFNAYQTLSWKDVAYHAVNPKFNARIECLPFLIFQVHKALSMSIDGGFGSIHSVDEINGITNSCLNKEGLIFSLVDRLRTCEDKNIQFSLRKFIHQFFKNQPYYYFPARKRLWLNIISNDKLYVDLNEEYVDKILSFNSDSYIVNPFYLFFDSTGKRRVTADLEWEGDSEEYPTNFPDDLDHAFIYAGFLKSKNVKPKFATEIHKRLFDIVAKK